MCLKNRRGRTMPMPARSIRVRSGGLRCGAAPKAITTTAFAPKRVHQALLRMCAARGDLFAILTLPEHYREDDASAHAAKLRSLLGEQAPELSYGAIYHPWLIGREESRPTELRRVPPDGAITG